jgi:single-strand DNA-binding protein
MNNITLIGHLTADLERRVTNNGTVVAKGRMAVPGAGDKIGEKAKDNPGFFNIESYGAGAEQALRYLSKGMPVAVQGRLQHNTWEHEGQTRQSYSVVGNIEFLPINRGSEGREQEQETGAAAEAEAGAGADSEADAAAGKASKSPQAKPARGKAAAMAGAGAER